MLCETCSAPLTWEPCATCEGEGGWFDYFDDDGDADGEWRQCPTCEGEEGWWGCNNDHAGVFGSDA